VSNKCNIVTCSIPEEEEEEEDERKKAEPYMGISIPVS
jgi:hypothetical protein